MPPSQWTPSPAAPISPPSTGPSLPPSQPPSPPPLYANLASSRADYSLSLAKKSPPAAVADDKQARPRGMRGRFVSRMAGPRACIACKRTDTTQWRNGNNGESLCNACGIRLTRKATLSVSGDSRAPRSRTMPTLKSRSAAPDMGRAMHGIHLEIEGKRREKERASRGAGDMGQELGVKVEMRYMKDGYRASGGGPRRFPLMSLGRRATGYKGYLSNMAPVLPPVMMERPRMLNCSGMGPLKLIRKGSPRSAYAASDVFGEAALPPVASSSPALRVVPPPAACSIKNLLN